MRRAPAGDPALAVAYLRVSTEEQHLGPEAQRAAITQWASRETITLTAWHTDAGVSGASEHTDRPGLTAALEDLSRHGAGVLAIARRDRIARDVVVAATIERTVLRRGARVVSADGVGNGDTPADQFMRTILDGAAAYERELIRARTRAALQARRAQGKRAGTVPWGYHADPDGKLSPNDPERTVIARVEALRAQGKSLREIVKTLEHEALFARTGRPLQLTQVARIARALETLRPTVARSA